MARISIVIPAKPGLASQDEARCLKFAQELKTALIQTCKEHAIKISSLPDAAFGTEAKVAKGASGTPTSDAVQAMVVDLPFSHTELQARSFLSDAPKDSFGRAHFGYVSEEGMHAWMLKNSSFKQNVDYLYNKTSADPPSFPISFSGTGSSARPDWRLSLPNSDGEALFDATSPGQEGHLCWKKVNGKTVDKMSKVLFGAEVIYEDDDSYSSKFGGGKAKRVRKYTQRYSPY